MIVRVNKNSDYTVMSNVHLKDRNLSLKAKGLLSVVLSLPDNWEYSIAGLMSISREKEASINAALKELKENGYLIITKKMPNQTNSGRIEYEWDFYEQPKTEKQAKEKQGVENQGLDFLGLEIQGLENQGQLNTNIVNTEISNTNVLNTESMNILEKTPKKRFVPPTVEEVRAYCDERGNDVDPEKFVAYYNAANWYRGKTKITNWKQCVITWERNSYGRPINTSGGSNQGGNEFTAYLSQMEATNG